MTRPLRHGDQRDRGAALVEFAFVALPLTLILFAIAEFGLAFKDSLLISSATRSAARVGTAAGTDSAADWLMLQAIESAVGSGSVDDIETVTIFKAKANGDIDLRNVYTQANNACGWTPCPDPGNFTGYGNPGQWPPAARNVTIGPGFELDRLGVKVEFRHDWITGILPGLGSSIDLNDTAVMRMEPQQFGP